ncbi:hypothetical protein C8J57DRAFT_1525632 [Mycena rebaudengoi]|nr:hypothetical protein C8J57DRAFT_1525632 [Mycena rebaudengoi]
MSRRTTMYEEIEEPPTCPNPLSLHGPILEYNSAFTTADTSPSSASYNDSAMYEEQDYPAHRETDLPASCSHPSQPDSQNLDKLLTRNDPSNATFRNLSLSTSFNRNKEQSELSLDWVLASGIPATHSRTHGILSIPCTAGFSSIYLELSIVSSLPFDLVLGRDWLQYCWELAFDTVMQLSDCHVDLRASAASISGPSPQPSQPDTNTDTMDIDADTFTHTEGFISEDSQMPMCDCGRPLTCRCPSTSASVPLHTPDVSHIYPALVERLSVLDRGYGQAWNPPIPALPERPAYTPPSRKRPRDTATDVAFDNVSAASPTAAKKAKHM